LVPQGKNQRIHKNSLLPQRNFSKNEKIPLISPHPVNLMLFLKFLVTFGLVWSFGLGRENFEDVWFGLVWVDFFGFSVWFGLVWAENRRLLHHYIRK
jgi:hypothetical protein